MRTKFVSVLCGFSFVLAALLAGCAENNPTAIETPSTNDNGLFKIVAAIGPGNPTDTVGLDTLQVGANVVFMIIDLTGLKDSVVSVHWEYGDGGQSNAVGLTNGEHRYTAAGNYTVTLGVNLIGGRYVPCGREIVLVQPGTNPNYVSADSLFMNISSIRVGSSNVWTMQWGESVLGLGGNVTGNNPFNLGWQDDWSNPVLLMNQPKSANNRMYIVSKDLEAGRIHRVGLGKKWVSANVNSTWLSDVEQVHNRYFDPATHNMAFFLGFNGIAYRVDSIPADSGRGTVPPIVPDSLLPGIYGDIGAGWRVRFEDHVHGSNLDTVRIFCNLDSMGCVSDGVVMSTNIPNSRSAITMTVPSGKKYAYADIAVSEMPSEGLVWIYARGICRLECSGSKYWSTVKNAFWGTWSRFTPSLNKAAAGTGNFRPVQ